MFAGWKRPLLVREKSGDIYMNAHWFPTWWGEIFWDLYKIYIKDIRPHTNSPFLFISNSGPTAGQAYTIKQYNKQPLRAVGRVGVPPHKASGGTSHGLRHMYGQTLTDAGVSQAVIQKAMHHKSDASTAIYTRPDAFKINKILNDAQMPHARIESRGLDDIGLVRHELYI